MDKNNIIGIQGKEFFFKIVDFLQVNWALIDEHDDGSARVWFIHDASGVFDDMDFESLEAAVDGLVDNGFDLYNAVTEIHEHIKPPLAPFRQGTHANGRIYSSGRFWKTARG
jgi:hypothetical protein